MRLTKAQREAAIERIKELQTHLKPDRVIRDIVTNEYQLSPDQYRTLYDEAKAAWAAAPPSNEKARWTSVLQNLASKAAEKGQLSAAIKAVAEIIKIQGLDQPEAASTEAEEIEAARLAELLAKRTK